MRLRPKALMQGIEIPSGEQVVRIVDAYDDTAKSSGEEMTVVVFEILDGNGTTSGLRLYEYFVKGHPAAQRRLLVLLEVLDLVNRDEIESKDLIGRQLKVVVAVDQFRGLPQGRIKVYLSAGQ